MNDSLKAVSAEIENYAEEVFSGKKTLLQIERHMLRKGYAPETVCITMDLIREAVSRRKKGNGKDVYTALDIPERLFHLNG